MQLLQYVLQYVHETLVLPMAPCILMTNIRHTLVTMDKLTMKLLDDLISMTFLHQALLPTFLPVFSSTLSFQQHSAVWHTTIWCSYKRI